MGQNTSRCNTRSKRDSPPTLDTLPTEIQGKIYESVLASTPLLQRRHNPGCPLAPSKDDQLENIPWLQPRTMLCPGYPQGQCNCRMRQNLQIVLVNRSIHAIAFDVLCRSELFTFVSPQDFVLQSRRPEAKWFICSVRHIAIWDIVDSLDRDIFPVPRQRSRWPLPGGVWHLQANLNSNRRTLPWQSSLVPYDLNVFEQLLCYSQLRSMKVPFGMAFHGSLPLAHEVLRWPMCTSLEVVTALCPVATQQGFIFACLCQTIRPMRVPSCPWEAGQRNAVRYYRWTHASMNMHADLELVLNEPFRAPLLWWLQILGLNDMGQIPKWPSPQEGPAVRIFGKHQTITLIGPVLRPPAITLSPFAKDMDKAPFWSSFFRFFMAKGSNVLDRARWAFRNIKAQVVAYCRKLSLAKPVGKSL